MEVREDRKRSNSKQVQGIAASPHRMPQALEPYTPPVCDLLSRLGGGGSGALR